ncbi:MAG TPA: hypothetical protein VIL01_11020 [Thermomicrobiales bacterium]
MTTRAELRSAVRQRLEDTGATPLWDDAALNDFLAEAMHTYGSRFPAERSVSVAVASGATSVPVQPPLDRSQVVRVVDGAGRVVPRMRRREGNATGEQAWDWWGSELVLAAPAVAGTWRIDYLGSRSLPADDVTTVEIREGDEEIVVALAAAIALRRRAVEDGKRGVGSDGAMAALADRFAREAERLIEARWRRARGGWMGE